MKLNHTFNQETLLRRNPDQLFSAIDDEVVMLSILNEEYYNISSIGSFIWRELELPNSFGSLINKLCEVYEVDKQVCIDDTSEFIIKLIAKNIIQIVDE